MKLWVMRHADAGTPSSDPTVERSRTLTAEGGQVARAVARAMAVLEEVPRTIIASDYARTLETADVVGAELGKPVSVGDALGPHMPVGELVRSVLEYPEAKRVMLVGHMDNLNPWVEGAAGDADPFAKGEVRRYKIDRETGKAKLKWRLRPSDLGFHDVYEDPPPAPALYVYPDGPRDAVGNLQELGPNMQPARPDVPYPPPEGYSE